MKLSKAIELIEAEQFTIAHASVGNSGIRVSARCNTCKGPISTFIRPNTNPTDQQVAELFATHKATHA